MPFQLFEADPPKPTTAALLQYASQRFDFAPPRTVQGSARRPELV
jgi:hypothetical protein